MKSIEDTVSEIQELIAGEETRLTGNDTSHLESISRGRLAALTELLEWILD